MHPSLKFELQRQAFIAQQPQATAWQTPPIPPPNVQENFIPTSARIEEVPSIASGRSSRSGSHPTFQRNDNGTYYQGHHSPQSEVPQSTNFSYGQYTNYAGVPAQTTTFIPHNVGTLEYFSGYELNETWFRSSTLGIHLGNETLILLPLRLSIPPLHLFSRHLLPVSS